MWKRIIGYGLFLGLGSLALQWLDYQHLAHSYPGNVYIGLIALSFLGLGFWVGAKVLATAPPEVPRGNPKAVAALGISARELEVLHLVSDGNSNKDIAGHLGVSPNTIKTHIARLFNKLEAKRRTEAIRRARDLGIVD
jgi:DNA-binding CsgD family transcriptional regulator